MLQRPPAQVFYVSIAMLKKGNMLTSFCQRRRESLFYYYFTSSAGGRGRHAVILGDGVSFTGGGFRKGLG